MLIVLILLVPSLLLSISMFNVYPQENAKTADEAGDAIDTLAVCAKTTWQTPVRGSRGPRAVEIENNDKPQNATLITSSTELITGTVTSGSDDDWFKKKLEVNLDALSSDERYVQNLTLSLSGWGGNSDSGEFFQVLLYGVLDINQNGNIEWDTEMIFLKAEHYQIGFSSTRIIWTNSYATGFYYILFRSDNARAEYNFQLSVSNIMNPGETNQNIDHATSLSVSPTSPVIHQVRIDTDPFDWFDIRTTSTSGTIGINFSLNLKIDTSLKPDTIVVDETTVHFVTVLHILVYHEDKIGTGDKPIFPYQFRKHMTISRHPYPMVDWELQYYDVITLPTKLFKHTFLGFYVQSYGMRVNKLEDRLYPFLNNIAEITTGWATFTIEEAGTSKISRPELSKVSVVSTTTNSIYGRTYDSYKYSVVYKQPENKPPIITYLSAFGLEGEIWETMVKVSKKTTKQDVFKLGCRYEFVLSGALLGEGNHHVFQLHFKDHNSWASGSIELGKTWHGPYISNNIRPYIRPTAPTELTLYEDDNTTFFDLNSIFEDTDLKEELNFSIAEPKDELAERVWGKYYSDQILEAKIVNNTRLRIDLRPNKFGDVVVLLNVSDKKFYYLNSTFEFTIKVLPVNDPPQIIEYFSYIVLKEDQKNTEINLNDHFADPIDGDELTFRVENNRNIDVTINNIGGVTLKPKPNWYGKEYIDFFASDGEEEVSDYLKVIVNSVNDVPILNINETIELWEDNWSNFTLDVLDAADNESVVIGQNLTEIFPNLARSPEDYGYSFDNTTGFLTIKPTNSMVGTYSWNISAIDIRNALNFTHVKLIINNVNDPPEPKIIFPMSGSRYLTTDKISFTGKVYDPDKSLKGIETDPIRITWYSTLHGVRQRIGTGLILEPQLYENGTHTITLTADDGEFTRNASIVIHVYAINKKLDLDGDGIPDFWENLYNLNTKDPLDADEDFDSDTFSNWEEYKGQTDPRDPNNMPNKHYSREGAADDTGLLTIAAIFVLLIILMIFILFYMYIKSRRRKREEQETEEKRKAEEAAMAEGKKKAYGKYKPPKVVCHVCGASFEIMTLNRPVAITCNQCGSRGAIYK